MKSREFLKNKVKCLEKQDFVELAFEVFSYQVIENEIYRSFVRTLKGEGFRPKNIDEIPFLPVSFFKRFKVVSGNYPASHVYRSSATTGSVRSEHHVIDNSFYLENALQTFEEFYGSIEDWTVCALLPGYLERGDSSLIAMTQYFIEKSGSSLGGFYLDDFDHLLRTIAIAKDSNTKVLLLGVSFALLQLADRKIDLSGVVVMETGGMKGRGKEIPKKAFHKELKEGLGVKEIHSEYGMTELLSQAYSLGAGIFHSATSMRVVCKDITDPLTSVDAGKSGIINVIDLANIDSCSFIETQDLGIVHGSGNFELLGRVDAAEIRGCNLLVSDI